MFYLKFIFYKVHPKCKNRHQKKFKLNIWTSHTQQYSLYQQDTRHTSTAPVSQTIIKYIKMEGQSNRKLVYPKLFSRIRLKYDL